MDLTSISLGAAIAILAISMVILAIFGLKNIISGKHDIKMIISIVSPVVIFGISYAAMGAVSDAGIMTMLIMIGIMSVLLLLSGLRSIL